MEDRLWKVIGFWAMGLLLFMATMIIIRWVVDFITWSTLDSGWTQAIGSLAALLVAIYVMSKQNAHAARLLVDADTLVFRRRAAAVSAIVERAVRVANAVYDDLDITPAEIADTADYAERLNGGRMAIQDVVATVKSIPTYELGSYDMAEAIHLLGANLEALSEGITRLHDSESGRGSPNASLLLKTCIKHIRESKLQFGRGMNEIR
ncbi:MAG: hypothetical protein ACJ8LG_06460 [Massilia sp.]